MSFHLACAQSNEIVRLDFSLYYPASQSPTDGAGKEGAPSSPNRRALKVLDDLYYAQGKKNIPLHIKQARQTILYPYRGPREFSIFRLETVDGEEVRKPIAKATIPEGVNQVVFVLLDDPKKPNGYRLQPFWMNPQHVKKGTARLLNLSGRDIALSLNQGKPDKVRKGIIKKQKGYTVPGQFGQGEDFSFVTLEAYVTRKSNEPYQFKVLHRDLMIRRQETSVFLLVQKQRHFIDMLSLSLQGSNNPREKQQLQKHLNADLTE